MALRRKKVNIPEKKVDIKPSEEKKETSAEVKTTPPSVNLNNIMNHGEMMEYLDTIMRDEMKKRMKEKSIDYNVMISFLTEYLKTFIVIGYNLNGEKTVFAYTPSEADKDALVENVRHTFFTHMINQ